MVSGVILAGGYSKRANTNKLLLQVDNKPLILHTIDSLKSFVDKIIVVTGNYDKELRPYLKDVEVVFNNNYPLGMFSSVLCGVETADTDVLVLPGDMANIAGNAIKSILNANGEIRIPTYHGKTGHPLFLSHKLVKELLLEDIDSNLRKFIDKNLDKVTYVEVDDPFITIDVDTIEDYKKFISLRKETTL